MSVVLKMRKKGGMVVPLLMTMIIGIVILIIMVTLASRTNQGTETLRHPGSVQCASSSGVTSAKCLASSECAQANELVSHICRTEETPDFVCCTKPKISEPEI